MEHEVFVPVPAERLRDVLADPVRVARAVPGLQQDAGAEPVAGRLKVRIGSHSITYRGSLRLSARGDGTYAVEGDATESRGTGAVALALTLRADDAEGGATLTFTGTATADGRVAELPPDSVASAANRLLARFAENLGTAAQAPPRRSRSRARNPNRAPPPSSTPRSPRPPSRTAAAAATATATATRTRTQTQAQTQTQTRKRTRRRRRKGTRTAAGARTTSRPSRPRRGRARAPHDDRPQRRGGGPRPAARPVRPRARAPAERGRRPLRWAAPAAALVVASAIVVGRALRKRR